ncbi:MAG: hypothetical protein JY451_08865 [Erythrobacter sp.]|nr:MAG: hypothetical protein JY451_08865 [Erythrobacter sp.]
MIARIFTTAAAAIALSATPVLAQSAPIARTSAPVEGQAEGAGTSGILIGLIALALIAGAVVIALEGGDEDDLPTSP